MYPLKLHTIKICSPQLTPLKQSLPFHTIAKCFLGQVDVIIHHPATVVDVVVAGGGGWVLTLPDALRKRKPVPKVGLFLLHCEEERDGNVMTWGREVSSSFNPRLRRTRMRHLILLLLPQRLSYPSHWFPGRMSHRAVSLLVLLRIKSVQLRELTYFVTFLALMLQLD